MQSEREETPSTGFCQICTEKSFCVSYGLESCRACAAFFRRAVISGQSFTCSSGENNCPVNSKVRCICRKCRLRKCLELGMKPDLIKRPRGALKVPEIAPVRTVSVVQCVGTDPCTSVGPPKTTSLTRMYGNYRQLRADRLNTELELLQTMEYIKVDDPRIKDKYLLTIDNITRIEREQQAKIIKFAIDTFQQYHQINEVDKFQVLRHFYVHFYGFNLHHRTATEVPPELYERFAVMTEIGCLDALNLDIFANDGGETAANKQKYQHMRKLCAKERRRPMVLWASMKPRDEEIAALIALTFWDIHAIEISKETEAICKEARKEIFYELHQFYKSVGEANSLERFGELMCLHTAFNMHTASFFKDAHILYIFGLFDNEPFAYDMIR